MVDFLGSLSDWLERHDAWLRSQGKLLVSRSPEDGREKPSMTVNIHLERGEVELLLWQSGEAEYAFGPVPEMAMEHHDLSSIVELDALLSRFKEAAISLSPVAPGDASPTMQG